MERLQQLGIMAGVVACLTFSSLGMASATDLTQVSGVLEGLRDSSTSWAAIILVAMLVLGLVVVSMTHFADLRQVLGVPLVLAIIAALVVASPDIIALVGLGTGATLDEVVVLATMVH